jgi:3-oxoacyl-[acyl-carrier protein] reductase
MLARDTGRIIFISSESAVSPAPEMAHYSATKTMQLSISRSLAEMTKGSKVTVNAVLAGSTRTEGVEEFVGQVFPGLAFAEAEKRFIAENRPNSLLGRLIDPREIGDAVAFICSDKASAINGAAVRVDGGLVRSVF